MFVIDVRCKGGLTSARQAAFTTTAARWARIIVADVPSVVVAGEMIDVIVIDAGGTAIDGPQGILGQAGPTQLRPGSFLPAAGIVEFDAADLATMQADGRLVNVVTHEMGRVLVLGSIWDDPVIANPDDLEPLLALVEEEGTTLVALLGDFLASRHRLLPRATGSALSAAASRDHRHTSGSRSMQRCRRSRTRSLHLGRYAHDPDPSRRRRPDRGRRWESVR